MQSLSKDFHAPLIQKGVKNETKNKQTSLHTDAADKIKNCSICELFSQEIAANTSTILIHPTQTALYYHRRFLISHYSTLFQHHLLASENTVDTQTKHTETEKYYNLTTETDFIASIKTDFLSEEEQQKVNVNTQSYTKWLKENAC